MQLNKEKCTLCSNLTKNYVTDFSNITNEELLELVRSLKIYFNEYHWINNTIPEKFKKELESM